MSPLDLLIAMPVAGLMAAAGLATVNQLAGPPGGDRPDGAAPVAPDAGLRTLLASLAWGFGVVPLFTLWVNLFTGVRVTLPLLVAVAAANLVAAAVAAAIRARGAPPLARMLPVTLLARALGGRRAVLVAGGLVAAVYLLAFDARHPLDDSCIYNAAFLATGQSVSGQPVEDVDLLRTNPDDARLGNSALLAAALVLFGPLGFRLAFALCAFAIALGGYVVGRDAGGRGWGWFGLVFLPLNSYVLTIALPDENLFALAIGTALLPLMLGPREDRDDGAGRAAGRWIVLGALFGLLLCVRHAMILSFAAPLLVAWRERRRAAAVGAFLVAVAVVTLPEHLHHLYALGSVLKFESNPQFPPLPYELLGVRFHWQGFVNWPLHDQVVRTPHNPFPTFVAWPLALAHHFGLILFALLHAGFVRVWLRSRERAAFWALWAVPVVAAIAVQEAWDQANKMGVILMVATAFVPWIAAGGEAVRRRPVAAGGAVAALVLASWAGTAGIRDWRVPADERYYCLPGAWTERADLVDRAAAEATDAGLLPRPPVAPHVSGRFLAGSAVSLREALRSPSSAAVEWPLGFFGHEVPPPGEPVTLVVDLSRDPFGAPFVTTDRGPADLDLTAPGAGAIVEGLSAPWSRVPMTVVARRSATATGVMVDFDQPPAEGCPPPPDPGRTRDAFLLDNRCEVLSWLVGDTASACPLRGAAPVRRPDPVLRLRVPSGVVNVALVVNWRGENYRLWAGIADASGLAPTAQGVRFWHN
ncbi:MAG: hypothetical protein FJ087_00115 [Deltaproteobacteria bacterium]|nr:hypothetical protein [Deltaproteobacteria bacterium]